MLHPEPSRPSVQRFSRGVVHVVPRPDLPFQASTAASTRRPPRSAARVPHLSCTLLARRCPSGPLSGPILSVLPAGPPEKKRLQRVLGRLTPVEFESIISDTDLATAA